MAHRHAGLTKLPPPPNPRLSDTPITIPIEIKRSSPQPTRCPSNEKKRPSQLLVPPPPSTTKRNTLTSPKTPFSKLMSRQPSQRIHGQCIYTLNTRSHPGPSFNISDRPPKIDGTHMRKPRKKKGSGQYNGSTFFPKEKKPTPFPTPQLPKTDTHGSKYVSHQHA